MNGLDRATQLRWIDHLPYPRNGHIYSLRDGLGASARQPQAQGAFSRLGFLDTLITVDRRGKRQSKIELRIGRLAIALKIGQRDADEPDADRHGKHRSD